MTQKELMLLYSYIYNQRCQLEDNVKEIQNNIRFRTPSVADCVELICAIQHLDSFKEITSHIRSLLNLNE